MDHADSLDIHAARVGEGADEEPLRADIVDPYPLASGASLGDHTLHRAAGDEEFLKHACVELGERASRGGSGVGAAMVGGYVAAP